MRKSYKVNVTYYDRHDGFWHQWDEKTFSDEEDARAWAKDYPISNVPGGNNTRVRIKLKSTEMLFDNNIHCPLCGRPGKRIGWTAWYVCDSCDGHKFKPVGIVMGND